MKYIFLIFGLVCHLTLLDAQVQKLLTHQFVATAQLDLTKDELNPISSEASPENKNRIKGFSTRLFQNELLIAFQLEDTGEDGFYLVSLEISMDGQSILADPAFLLGDIGKVNLPSAKKEKQIAWTNLIAQLPDSKGLLQLTVKAEWWGVLVLPYGVKCDQYPTFAFKQKLPYLAAMTGGAGMVFGGIIIREKAHQHLELHKSAHTLSERKGEFQEYKDKLQTAKMVAYVGAGIMVLDALFYFIRSERYEKQLDIFEKNCGSQDALSVNPFWEPANKGNPQQLGFHLSYQF